MAGIPITRNEVSSSHEGRIRRHVQDAVHLPSGGTPSRLATEKDAEALFQFLSDPDVHAPIYSLPSPLNLKSVEGFIEQHMAERDLGQGLLFIRPDEYGDIMGYSDIQVWPQWGAAELGGAIRPDRQGQRAGIIGAAASFTWMFEALELELICETAALDNIRTAKLLDHLGFHRRGEITSDRADGSPRQSLVWEITKYEWSPPTL